MLKYDCHLRSYGRDFNEQREEGGFKVEVVDFVKKFSIDEVTHFGLDCKEDLYICHKDRGDGTEDRAARRRFIEARPRPLVGSEGLS